MKNNGIMKKILVVDDDIDILNIVKIALTPHDFVVKTTSRWQNILKPLKLLPLI